MRDLAEDRLMLRDKEPTATFTTARSVDEVAACIESGLRAVADPGSLGSLAVTDEGSTRVIRMTTMANPTVVITLAPAPQGTQVDYRSRYRTGYGAVTNAVLGCR